MIVDKKFQYKIHHQLCCFDNYVYMCVRAGNYPKLHCSPNNADLEIENYKEHEVFFINASQDEITSEVIVEKILNNNLNANYTCDINEAYSNIKQIKISAKVQETFNNIEGVKYITAFDGKMIIPNISTDLTIGILDAIACQYVNHETVRTSYINEIKRTIIPKCRSCGEYDPYALVEADNIIDDGNYTCWGCANHPYRWFKNVPDHNKESFINHYKIRY